MPLFKVWVVDTTQTKRQLFLFGLCEYSLKKRVESYTYKVDSCYKVYRVFPYRFTDQHRYTFFQNVSSLLQGGIPLKETLELLAIDTYDFKMKYLYQTLYLQIEHGLDLIPNDMPDFFDDISKFSLINLKKTNVLIDVLTNLVSYYETKIKNDNEWKKIIYYPCVLWGMICLLMTVVSQMVMPHLLTLIPKEQRGFAFESFEWFTTHIEWIICSSLFGFFVLHGCRHKILLMVPVLYRLKLIHFWTALAFCLKNNIPVIDALEIAIQTQEDPIKSHLKSIITHLKKGYSVQNAFGSVPYFTKNLKMLIKISQKTGDFKTIISNFAKVEERYGKNIINFIMCWTQPFLVSMMGLVIIWILCATLLPLYDSISEIHG